MRRPEEYWSAARTPDCGRGQTQMGTHGISAPPDTGSREHVRFGGVDVAGHRDSAPFVGGVGDAVERLGGVLPGGQHADVVDDDEAGAADPGDGPGDGPVGPGPADRGDERLQGEPGDPQVFLDRGVGQGLDQVGLARAGRAGDHEVLRSADPFQGGERVLGGAGDGGFLHNLVYANADLSKATQPREVIAFCDHWKQVAGSDPKMLIMDQKVTTQEVLGELDERGVKFLTLRMRSPSLVKHISSLGGKDFTTITLDRPGPHNKPKVHEDPR